MITPISRLVSLSIRYCIYINQFVFFSYKLKCNMFIRPVYKHDPCTGFRFPSQTVFAGWPLSSTINVAQHSRKMSCVSWSPADRCISLGLAPRLWSMKPSTAGLSSRSSLAPVAGPLLSWCYQVIAPPQEEHKAPEEFVYRVVVLLL